MFPEEEATITDATDIAAPPVDQAVTPESEPASTTPPEVPETIGDDPSVMLATAVQVDTILMKNRSAAAEETGALVHPEDVAEEEALPVPSQHLPDLPEVCKCLEDPYVVQHPEVAAGVEESVPRLSLQRTEAAEVGSVLSQYVVYVKEGPDPLG